MKYLIILLSLGFICSQVMRLDKAPSKYHGLANGVGKMQLDNFDDFQYYGEFEIGTPAQKTTIITDTGSNQLWIPTNKPECYNQSKSTTANVTKTPGSIQYGQGYVAGYMGTEVLGLSSLGLTNLKMITLFVDKEEQMGGQKACGLMGLSNDPSWKNFIDVAKDDGKLPDAKFGFRLKDTDQKTYFYIGESSFPFVEISWLTVVRSNYWAVAIQHTIIDGKSFPQPTGMQEAVLDTGTSLILMATEAMNALVMNWVIASQCQCQQSFYFCPCEGVEYPLVYFISDKYMMEVKPDNYMIYLGGGYCMLGFQGIDASQLPFVILGDAFLRGYFYSLDKVNNQVGLSDLLYTK